MAEYIELKKANGDVFLEVRRMPDNSYISMSWIGIQSLETVMMGCNYILTMLREKPCPRLLNSNRELIGPWEVAVSWLTHKWVPQIEALGVHYFAHVLSPGIYGRRSFQSLQSSLTAQLKLEVFEYEKEAEEWLTVKFA